MKIIKHSTSDDIAYRIMPLADENLSDVLANAERHRFVIEHNGSILYNGEEVILDDLIEDLLKIIEGAIIAKQLINTL